MLESRVRAHLLLGMLPPITLFTDSGRLKKKKPDSLHIYDNISPSKDITFI